ncbi:MAG: aminotransferase class I/II-fold pyridoxal phosphate-dependent enzyme [Polyangiaceae bacterium]|nr:aminotransferase class I/II-fold pyridoxal phosphate-dependent enzyme [Polyangiaceae bacterium]
MTTTRALGLSSLSVHAGEPSPAVGPLEAPLVLSSAFGFASAEEAEGAFRGDNDAYVYGRWGNPNVELLERKVAALEGARDAAAAASGMAAISGALLSVCGQGDHVVAPRSIYGETPRLLRERLPRLGITTTFVDDVSPEGYRAALGPHTRVVYVETPSNPTLAVTDVAAVAEVARRAGALSIVDNTFATPYCQRPLELGVDLVVHSMTKFLCGHGDAIGGVVAGDRELVERARELTVKGLGGALAPFNALLICRGLRTFALRMRAATATATSLAARLSSHPAVRRVHHPSLPAHPGHAIASRQMRAMPAILSFEVADLGAARRVRDGVRLVTHAVSLGDARTLLTHPASTTASTMPAEDRARAGVTDGLLRLAVGIEDEDDLYADLDRALGG